MCNIEIKLVFSISKIVCLLSVKDPTLNGFVQATCTIFLVQAVVPATAVKLPETFTHLSVNTFPANADVFPKIRLRSQANQHLTTEHI